MAFKLATAFVEITARDSQMRKQFGQTQQGIVGMIGGIRGLAATAGGLLALNKARESIDAVERQIEAEQRLRAALRATDEAAGFSFERLAAFASQLQKVTTTGDEEIQELMAILTTFKSISGDVFKRTTEAALDLSATGFGSAQQAIVQLAKAIEDPIRGLGALRRVGVSFSEQQEKQIKQFAETGDLLKAQEMLLDAVEGQVKGVARAMADTPVGRIKQMKNEIGDMEEEIGRGLIPVMYLWNTLKRDTLRVIGPLVNSIIDLQKGLNRVGTAYSEARKEGWGFVGMIKGMDAALRDAIIQLLEFSGLVRKPPEIVRAVRGRGRTGQEDTQEVTAPSGLESGFLGFEQLNRSIQESLLKADHPAEETNRLLEMGNVSRSRQEQLLQQIANNTSTGLAVASSI